MVKQKIDLAEVSTAELVSELEKRKDVVKTQYINPDEQVSINVGRADGKPLCQLNQAGPCVVLSIID